MGSTYGGEGIFNSGPHRFSEETVGEYVLINRAVDPLLAGSTPIGALEQRVTVRGRLVADDEAGLWALRAAVGVKLVGPPSKATLVDHGGKTYEEMSFTEFEVDNTVDKGRKVSVGYVARFIRFAPEPW